MPGPPPSLMAPLLPLVFQLFFIQLLVGLTQQVLRGAGWGGDTHHGGGPGGLPLPGAGARGPSSLFVFQWMVPTIQNSMKPFRVSDSGGVSRMLGGVP